MTGRLTHSKRALTIAVLPLSALIVSATLPEVALAETLKGAVRKAIETNPELGAIKHNRQAIDQELRAAHGLLLPSIDLRAEIGRQKRRSKTPVITNSHNWHTRREIGVIVGQRLFDGFEARHEIARQKSRVVSAKFRVADTANAIALRAIQAYLEIERARAVLAAAGRNLRALERLRSRVGRRVSAGQASRAERTEAGSRTANARALVAEARARLEDAKALYRSVVGAKPSHLHPSPAARHVPATLHAALATARSYAPSV
ncbi:MAG: TolC family protein, partial [Pseudomonadota bacterium]